MRSALFAAALGAATLAGVTAPRRAAAGDQLVFVRNASNPASSVSRGELKDMLIGKRKAWESGAAVQGVLGPPGSAQLEWIAALLGVSESTLMAKIRQEVFKGEMKRPIVAGSDQDCAAAVAANVGAIGVVSAATAKHMPAGLALLTVY